MRPKYHSQFRTTGRRGNWSKFHRGGTGKRRKREPENTRDRNGKESMANGISYRLCEPGVFQFPNKITRTEDRKIFIDNPTVPE